MTKKKHRFVHHDGDDTPGRCLDCGLPAVDAIDGHTVRPCEGWYLSRVARLTNYAIGLFPPRSTPQEDQPHE